MRNNCSGAVERGYIALQNKNTQGSGDAHTFKGMQKAEGKWNG